MHEVLRALTSRVPGGSQPGARADGLRVALAIEGGGMRGTISAGMAFALHELGLVPAFDAVYGASAGAITGAWLLSSRPEGLLGWTEPAYARTLIRRSGVLRGRPVADVRALIEELYQTTFPMDFASVLANPVEYHPLATDAATGESTDLRPFVGNPAELRLALRATFLGRDARLAAADRQLADYESAPGGQPAVLSIRPPASSPEVSRLATDGKLLLAAFEAGRAAARTALNGPSDQGS